MVGDGISAGSQDEGIDETPLIVPTGPASPSQRHTTPIKATQTPSPTNLADPLGLSASWRNYCCVYLRQNH